MLEINDLSKRYDAFTLGPIDLTLEPGTVHGLIGPNGAGKTTLFRSIMGTVRRDRGSVRIAGRPADPSSGAWRQGVGYVGDYTPLFDQWSGARNLRAFAAFYDGWSEERAASLASRLGLDLGRKAGAYSTGERTKLAVVLALAHRPGLLLLDEPANGLDPVTRETFMEILYEQMRNEELTMLYATHHVSEIEHMADQLVFIRDGRILAHEPVAALVENWRRITFRTSRPVGDIPYQVSRLREGDDHQVTTSRFESAVSFLESQGAERIETRKLTTEQICVHVLRNGAGRGDNHD
jgi:ABC-2 type transport system ATP-binding protein